MIKFLALTTIVFTLGVLAVTFDDAFAAPCTPSNNCHAQIRLSGDNITGLEYELDSPDLYIDRNACDKFAVSSGWLIADRRGMNTNTDWVESGVIKGELKQGGVGESVCITELATYYAIQKVDNMDNPFYLEYTVPNGRVDPGEDVTVKIEHEDGFGVTVTVSTADRFVQPTRFTLNSGNIFNVHIGIEGTVSAINDYSSIPMSKFTNMKVKQNNVWINMPSSATVFAVDTDQGYRGEKCRNNSFVAGSVTQIDCNVAATRN